MVVMERRYECPATAGYQCSKRAVPSWPLQLHDLAEARSRKAFDRIFEEGGRRRR